MARWKSPNPRHYITGSYSDVDSYGFHHREGISDSWTCFEGRIIINRGLRRRRRFQKARRLYGSLYFNQFGVQTAYRVKRTM